MQGMHSKQPQTARPCWASLAQRGHPFTAGMVFLTGSSSAVPHMRKGMDTAHTEHFTLTQNMQQSLCWLESSYPDLCLHHMSLDQKATECLLSKNKGVIVNKFHLNPSALSLSSSPLCWHDTRLTPPFDKEKKRWNLKQTRGVILLLYPAR